jgi:hypothetical protein
LDIRECVVKVMRHRQVAANRLSDRPVDEQAKKQRDRKELFHTASLI